MNLLIFHGLIVTPVHNSTSKRPVGQNFQRERQTVGNDKRFQTIRPENKVDRISYIIWHLFLNWNAFCKKVLEMRSVSLEVRERPFMQNNKGKNKKTQLLISVW
jgi:hypothetical protein